MGKILSQEEIDALLGAATTIRASRQSQEAPPATAITYDFRRPDRMSKEQVRSLHFLHDRFARNVSTSLSAYLRTVTEVSIVSVEQFTYSEFLMSLPDPTAFYAIALPPADGLGALELNPGVAFTAIDRMLGGRGERVTLSRALTEIEQNVIDAVVKLLLENLSETWAPVYELHFRIHGRETRPQMLQVAAPNDAMILFVFDLRVGEARGMMNLCIPATVLDAFGGSFSQSWHRARREPTAAERQALYDNVGRIPLPLSAVLETSLTARELLDLRPGHVLSLGVPVGRPLAVRAGGIEPFSGRPVLAGQHAGIQISRAPRTRAGQESTS